MTAVPDLSLVGALYRGDVSVGPFGGGFRAAFFVLATTYSQ